MTTPRPAAGDLGHPGPRPPRSIAFDRAAGFYDQSRGLDPAVEELVIDRFEEAVGPAGRLLEVGVGTGRIALPLRRRGREVVGATCPCRCWSATGPRRPRPATGRPGRSAPPAGRCSTAWPPWAAGSSGWSRSSGSSRRPTPRPCAGSRAGSAPTTGACPTRSGGPAAAQVRAELEAGQTDLDTPRPARHTFGFVATRF